MQEEEGTSKGSFVPSKGLTSAEAERLLAKHGRNELEEKKKPKVKAPVFLKLIFLNGLFLRIRVLCNFINVIGLFSYFLFKTVVNIYGATLAAHAYNALDCSHYRGCDSKLA